LFIPCIIDVDNVVSLETACLLTRTTVPETCHGTVMTGYWSHTMAGE